MKLEKHAEPRAHARAEQPQLMSPANVLKNQKHPEQRQKMTEMTGIKDVHCRKQRVPPVEDKKDAGNQRK